MKIITDTSVLISVSIYWKYEDLLVKDHFYDKCNDLFEFLRNNPDVGIVTKTVENEAIATLEKALIKTLKKMYFPDINSMVKIMTLQHIITNHCLDRLEKFTEECSTRLAINTSERERIKKNEIEPFLSELVKHTVRYIQPEIPRFVKDKSLRNDLMDIMIKSVPQVGIIYKGMPEDRDLIIMAEATFIHRKYRGAEVVYVASLDNHFKPNPVQYGSSLYNAKFLGKMDSTVRDRLANTFGFIGEEPSELLRSLAPENK